MASPDQPTAPYLDAVVGYAFRGSGRYHVPGHKGGQGADPGVRKAIGLDALAADVPQDIQGIDLGPSPTPYERAERLAAEAYGVMPSPRSTPWMSCGMSSLSVCQPIAVRTPRSAPLPALWPGTWKRVAPRKPYATTASR